MKKQEKIRQKLWIKALTAFTKSDKPIKSSGDAKDWANAALANFDKTFKLEL